MNRVIKFGTAYWYLKYYTIFIVYRFYFYFTQQRSREWTIKIILSSLQPLFHFTKMSYAATDHARNIKGKSLKMYIKSFSSRNTAQFFQFLGDKEIRGCFCYFQSWFLNRYIFVDIHPLAVYFLRYLIIFLDAKREYTSDFCICLGVVNFHRILWWLIREKRKRKHKIFMTSLFY